MNWNWVRFFSKSKLLKIPWAAWGITQPITGTVWGMNIQLNDKTPTSKSSTQWSDEGLDVNAPDGWKDIAFGQTAQNSCGPADTNTSGDVSITELMNHIANWKTGITTITKLIESIEEWKNGCNYEK